VSDEPEDDDADRLRHDPVLVAVEDAAEATIAAAREAKEASLWAAEAVDRMAFDKIYDPPPKGNGRREPFIKDKPKADDKPLPPSIVCGAGTFMSTYTPISYTVEGMLPSGFFYALTAKTGAGKTASAQAVTFAVTMNRPNIIGAEVAPGRVAYVTFENPTDFKMKLAAGCYVHGISWDEIEPRLAVIEGRDTPEQILEGLKLDAEANGSFQHVNIDTLQAGFSAAGAGKFNDNESILAYVMRLRPLAGLPGQPSILILCHPTKDATEDNLLPYGGGATVNEIDGNLTLWKSAQIKLHHTDKLRGPTFEPKYFRIEKCSCPDILDNKGRQILLPIMLPCTEMDAEERATQEGNAERALLKAMIENESGTQREWALRIGRSLSTLNSYLQRLKKEKLVAVSLGKWSVTTAGHKAAKAS
jgi:AAA domain